VIICPVCPIPEVAMARQRFDDDEARDPQPRRRDEDRGGGLKIVLAVVAGVFVLGVLACGGVLFLGYRQATQMRQELMVAEAEARRAEAEARADAEAVRADVDQPVPAGVPPQPAASKFDRPGDADRWVVLFRSADPDRWNSNTSAGDDFALPVKYAPADTAFLRLRRMDTGEAIIVPMTRGRVGRQDPEGKLPRWNGSNQSEYGGRHLGLATGPEAKWQEGKGTVAVLMDRFDATGGSGFGHGHHVEDGGQKYAWKGTEIPKTAFEIAVTAGDLTDAEKALVAK
jgi:hypothetical protein